MFTTTPEPHGHVRALSTYLLAVIAGFVIAVSALPLIAQVPGSIKSNASAVVSAALSEPEWEAVQDASLDATDTAQLVDPGRDAQFPLVDVLTGDSQDGDFVPDAGQGIAAEICLDGSSIWLNQPFSTQTGRFAFEFSVTPQKNRVDGLIALSPAAGWTFANFPVVVRFNDSGYIDARSSITYASLVRTPYVGGETYDVTVVVNLAIQRYDVYVFSPDSETPVRIAKNFYFRDVLTRVAALANIGVWSGLGPLAVCDTSVFALQSLTLNAGADQSVPTGGSVSLAASVAGGLGPYRYQWTPTTGLSDPTAARPLASPLSTTTYQLVVTDLEGAAASDVVQVEVKAGRVFYVDGAAAHASNTNPGTEALPWKTLTKAASTAIAGDTVLVSTGVYTEQLKPTNNGTVSSKITFKARPGHKPVIDGQLTRTSGLNFAKPNTFIRVEGFEIRNHKGNGVYFQPWGAQGVDGIEIVGNDIHRNTEDGIYARNSWNCLIENNHIHDNGWTAVSFAGKYGSTNLTIRGNDIHYNGKDGLQGGSAGLLIEGNKLYDQFHTAQHQDALDLSKVSDAVIRYNTFSDFTQLAYFHNLDGGFDNISIYGNVFYTNRYFTVKGGKTSGIFFDGRFTTAPATNISIHSNTFGWTGYSGIWMYGPLQNVTLRNNIFYDSGMDIRGSNGTIADSDYNILFRSTATTTQGPHTRNVDPKFAGYQRHVAWDFRLAADSPAIDAGDPNLGSEVPLPSPFRDLENKWRPLGSGYDIGAYERN